MPMPTRHLDDVAGVVESAAWERYPCFTEDFIIFCWLPPVGAYEARHWCTNANKS